MTKHRGAVSVVLGVVLVAGLSSAVFAGPNVLGQVLTDDVLVDGIRVPAGTTLYSPSVVSTDSDSAIVQLGIAQVLTLGENTTAKLEEATDGVSVDVATGSVSFLDRAGRLQELGEGTYRVEEGANRAPSIGRANDADWASTNADSDLTNDRIRDESGLRPTDRRANVTSRDGAADAARGEKWWWQPWWHHSGDDGSGGHDNGGHHGDDDGGHHGGHDDGDHGHGKQSPTNP